MILFGERALRHVLNEYVAHCGCPTASHILERDNHDFEGLSLWERLNYHFERNHQGIGNYLVFADVDAETYREGPVECRERIGGLLKFYYRQAA